MTGLSGSGKTWVSGQLMAALPAIRLRSDIERKRRFDLDENASSGSNIAAGIYSRDVSKEVYAQLNTTAEMLLRAGHNVILDASFLYRGQRRAAQAVAERTGSTCVILETVAGNDLLQARILARQKQRKDASEADLNVLDFQLQNGEPLTDEERQQTIRCESDSVDIVELTERVRGMVSSAT
jgi:hypothetical protein